MNKTRLKFMHTHTEECPASLLAFVTVASWRGKEFPQSAPTEPCSPLAKAKQHLTSDEITDKEHKGEVFCDIVKAFNNCSVWGQIT